MQKHRIISLASILVMLLIPVIGWFLVAQPQFAAAATADQQRRDIDAANQTSQAAVTQLKADSQNLDKLTGDLNQLRTSIPATVDSSHYIDGLNALATASDVTINTIAVTPPVAYAPPAVATPAAAADPSKKSDATPAPTAAPAPPVVANPAIVTDPLITPANFVVIPVTVEVKGTEPSVLAFISGLQSGGRLFLVSTLSTTRDDSESSFTASIGGFIYAIPTGVAGNPHPTSTIVKIMSTGEPETTTDDGATDGTNTDGNGGTPTPNPTATTAP